MNQTRRDFLKATLTAGAGLSFAATLPRFLTRSTMASSANGATRDTVLVVIQLSGGNDGLNTVVPYADDGYARSRPTLRLTASQVLKIDSQLGFHPRMKALHQLYQEGCLTIAQGVGYPNSDRNHPGAMRIWQTAEPQSTSVQTGWLGRAADRLANAEAGNIPAAFVGMIGQPFGVNTETVVVPSIHTIQEAICKPTPAPKLLEKSSRGDTSPWLELLRRESLQVDANSRRLESVLRASRPADYPQFPLATELRNVSQLIQAELGIRIFYLELGGGGIGGFDNHANQLGNHCAMLEQLSESMAAFVRDLQRHKLLDRVMMMTFSEFGRTVHENGRHGTNHGAAQPILLAGGKLKGGVAGAHPSLTDLDNDGLKFHTDFRQLYATALERWLGLDSRTVLGQSFAPLDLLKS